MWLPKCIYGYIFSYIYISIYGCTYIYIFIFVYIFRPVPWAEPWRYPQLVISSKSQPGSENGDGEKISVEITVLIGLVMIFHYVLWTLIFSMMIKLWNLNKLGTIGFGTIKLWNQNSWDLFSHLHGVQQVVGTEMDLNSWAPTACPAAAAYSSAVARWLGGVSRQSTCEGCKCCHTHYPICIYTDTYIYTYTYIHTNIYI